MRILGPDDRQLTMAQLVELPATDPSKPSEDTMPAPASPNNDQALDESPDILFTRLVIEGFRGIDLMEFDLKGHPRGVVFAGTKAIGKTSSIRGIEADLWGAGIDKSAIKTDSTGTKISMSYIRGGQELTAVRTISKSKTEAKLLPPDGIPLPKAVEQLRATFGSGIGSGGRDPLRLYSASKQDLREMLLAASPCAVTGEMLTRWCEEERPWSVDGHGQEVLARVKDTYFERRTDAGRELDKAEEEVKTRDADVAKLRAPDLPSITAAAAQTHVTAAERELAVLHDRRRQAEKREAEVEGTRARIAAMRDQAEQKMGQPELQPPAPEEMATATEELLSATTAVEVAEKALAQARARLDSAKAASADVEKRMRAAQRLQGEIDALVDQANQLEQAIAHTLDGDGDPIALQVAAAEDALEQARSLVAKATQADALRAAEAKAKDARATFEQKKAAWEKLDRVVKRLTTEAPAELAKHGNPIAGLEITPKSILWNGHDYDLMSDGEKLEFAVDVVKRISTGAKVMVIDKMESLPPSLRPGFVRDVLRGGWVLFATLVQDGPLEVVDCYRLAQKAA